MTTECNQEPFPFHPLNQREVRGQFDGGSITSDAGGLLLREVEKRTNIIGQFASCFTDYRDPELREHAVAELSLGLPYELGHNQLGFRAVPYGPHPRSQSQEAKIPKHRENSTH